MADREGKNRIDKVVKEEERWRKYIYYGAVTIGIVSIGVGAYYWYYHKNDHNDGNKSDEDRHSIGDEHMSNGELEVLPGFIKNEKIKEKGDLKPKITLQRLPSNLLSPEELKVDKIEEEDDEYTKQLKKYQSRMEVVKGWRYFNYRNGVLTVTVIKALNLDAISRDDENNTYVKLTLGQRKIKTGRSYGTNNPEWNETFEFEVQDAIRDTLLVKIRNRVLGGRDKKRCDDFKILVSDIIAQKSNVHRFRLTGTKGKAFLVMNLSYDEH